MSSMVKTPSGLFVPADAATGRSVQARYDAARTTSENARHWANADALSSNAANSAGVRKTLVRRSRYEFANNPYINGIIRTLANDTIGTGPRLQMHAGDESLNDRIERDFSEWADAVQLAVKLNTMRQAKARDGEGFGLIVNNPGLRCECGITLDVQVIETEMVSGDLFGLTPEELETDGIRLDRFGNPVSYTVLPAHPGSQNWTTWLANVRMIPAALMAHLYSPDRPGQTRGIPETTPVLPLCALLRRYTLATVSSAENIANISGVIKSTVPGVAEQAENTTAPMSVIEMERNRWVALPEGWDIQQPKAEQPTTTYAEFKRELLNEIARPFSMPYNVAAGNSSSYNYASGRLDHQTYFKAIEVERKLIALQTLEKVFANWIGEWQLQNGVVLRDRAHEWFWDGFAHIDPQKEAGATLTRLKCGITTMQREYARQGLDWSKEMQKAAEAFGLSLDDYRKRLTASIFDQPLIIQEGTTDEAPQRQ